MKLKQIEQAYKFFEQIKKLDTEINQLHKIAGLLANELTSIDVSISYKDMGEKQTDRSEHDHYIDAVPYLYRSLFSNPVFNPEGCDQRNNKKSSISIQMNEVSGLVILENIIKIKEAERFILISQLEQIGIKL